MLSSLYLNTPELYKNPDLSFKIFHFINILKTRLTCFASKEMSTLLNLKPHEAWREAESPK